MNQIKKLITDPDYQDINPDLILLARRNGYVKQPIQLYLTGQITWLEALETMVVSLGTEFSKQGEILAEEITANTEYRQYFSQPSLCDAQSAENLSLMET